MFLTRVHNVLYPLESRITSKNDFNKMFSYFGKATKKKTKKESEIILCPIALKDT